MTKSTVVLSVFLVAVGVLSLFIGAYDVTPTELLRVDGEAWQVFLASRLPRLAAVICTGAGMSIAGLIMQQLCANKFVSPTTGATIASAQLGILFAFIFLPTSTLVTRTLFAFAAAMIGTWTFVAFALRTPMKDPVMVPLIGIMLSSVINGVTGFLAFAFGMNQALSTWSVGHFSLIIRGRYEIVFLVLPLIIAAWVYARHFNIVGMGRDFSKNLGVNYTAVLAMGLTAAAMITASVVSVVGTIPYIGLVVPNIVAIFKGDDLRSTIADTALFGALFVLICDLVARLLIAPYELPIELIVGTAGSVIFIGLIFYRLKFGRKAWNGAAVRRLLGLQKKESAL